MEQLAPAASEAPQALAPVVMAKSVGFVQVMLMPLIVSAALPVFESVAACAALVAPETAVKVSVGGVSVAIAEAAMVKLAVTLCGALMVTVVEALPELATLPVQLVNV